MSAKITESSQSVIGGYVSSDNSVQLLISGTVVQEVLPERAEDGRYHFAFKLYDQWRFAGKSDFITVQSAGSNIPFEDGSTNIVPSRNGKETLADLDKRFQKGQRFDEHGYIKLMPKDEDLVWQSGVMGLYDEVAEVIRQVTGSSAFLYSGTLLGYVREGGFISFDKDMDCAYLSLRKTAGDAAREFEQVGLALIKAGYTINAKASCISVRREPGSRIMVDIAHLFLKSDGTVGFPFGTVGTEQVKRSEFLPVSRGEFQGYEVSLPSSPESVVEHIYGNGWRLPDPDFRWTERRMRRDPEALLSYTVRSSLAMDDHYAHSSRVKPSRFASYVLERDEIRTVSNAVDLGAGDGLDGISIQRKIENVSLVDKSVYATRTCLSNVQRADSDAAVVRLDLVKRRSLSGLVAAMRARTPGTTLFYARFLLSSLTNSEAAIFMAELREASVAGDIVAIEYRSTDDIGLRKRYSRSFRNYFSQSEGEDLISRAGFRVIDVDSGTTFSKYGKEDPDTIRIIGIRK